MTKLMKNPTELAEWQALKAYYQTLSQQQVRHLQTKDSYDKAMRTFSFNK